MREEIKEKRVRGRECRENRWEGEKKWWREGRRKDKVRWRKERYFI